METWDAIRSRRNIRSFADRPVPREHLDRILEAGRRAPSSQNWQPWDFIVVTDRAQLTALSKVWVGAQHVAQSAATVALIAGVPGDERQRDWTQYDLGQATMAMMITAADLGVGSGHAAVAGQDVAREVLGFPPDKFCAFLIALGYPADGPLRLVERPNRRPFDQVVHWGRW